MKSPSRLRRLIAGCLAEQRLSLALAALALLGVVVCDLLAPWPLKLIFDHVLLRHPLPPSMSALQPLLDLGTGAALALCAAAIAAIALASGALAYLQLYTSARVGHRITWQLRGALFAHLQRLSLAHHRSTRVGELVTRVAGDTNLLRDMFSDWLLSLGRHAVTLVAMLAVMFWLDGRLAMVVAATLPPLLAVIYLLNRRVKAAAREQRRQEGRMASRLNEVLGQIALVHAFGRQEEEEARFRQEIAANYESGMRSARVNGAIVKAIAVVSAVGTSVTVLVGAHAVVAGRITPGALLVFVSYVAALYKPVRDLGRLAGKFSRAGASAERVAQILDIEPDAEDAPDAVELTHAVGEIVFEDVRFAWREGRTVLDGLNLRIAAGERVALVGASGAGKSTLMNLLLRLAEPASGRILLDGVDIRRYTRASLRRAIGVVPQEPMLFAVPVRENIAYGRPDATQDEIEAAAAAARAHEFIVDLPEGYDTELGERASALSGGQRQRLCLARALVKQPAVLLMDEPTAAVDPRSARLIHEAVARVHRGRTLLVITHDEASLDAYDRVLVLEHGRVTDTAPRSGAPLTLVENRHA